MEPLADLEGRLVPPGDDEGVEDGAGVLGREGGRRGLQLGAEGGQGQGEADEGEFHSGNKKKNVKYVNFRFIYNCPQKFNLPIGNLAKLRDLRKIQLRTENLECNLY